MKLPLDTHTCGTHTLLGIHKHGIKGPRQTIRRVYALECFYSEQLDKLSMNAKVSEGACGRRLDMTWDIT